MRIRLPADYETRSKGTLFGPSDVSDSETTSFCERGLRVTKEKLRKGYVSRVGKEGKIESRRGPLWPKCLNKRVSKITNVKEASEALTKLGKLVATNAVKSGIVEKMATGFPELLELRRILHPDNFRASSLYAVRTAIANGDTATIVRVLETDIRWVVANIDAALRFERGSKAKLVFMLSPAQGDRSVLRIADNESRKIRGNSNLLQALEQNRGISPLSEITALRHLRLHTGTLVALYHLQKAWPQNVVVGFRDAEPSARCTIVEHQGVVAGAHYVELEEWGIGLDTDAFVLSRDDELSSELLREAKEPFTELGPDNYQATIEYAVQIENNILDSNSHGNRTWNAIESQIVRTDPSLDEKRHTCLPKQTHRDNHSLTRFEKILAIKPEEYDFATVSNIMEDVAEEQAMLDTIQMPRLRRAIETPAVTHVDGA